MLADAGLSRNKALQQTGLSVASLPLAPAAERRYVGRTRALKSDAEVELVTSRHDVLQALAARVLQLPTERVVRVAIDGVDGSGKTYLADELAQLLAASGRATVRASVDGFHKPQALRYRRGRESPAGFFFDSYDYDRLKTVLLDPLSPGGSCRYRVAIFDHRSDRPIPSPERVASAGEILLFDGIFLHRPELIGYWDFSIFLQVAFSVSIPRCAQRGEGSADPAAPQNQRYVQGQELYLATCRPSSLATVVINNDDLASPYFVRPSR
jgi:uridine kinase